MAKMNVPKSIKVGGLTYPLMFKKIKPQGEFHIMGQCNFRKREIYIDPSLLNNEELYFTLFHEILHAAMDAATVNDEIQNENLVHPFSRIFWGALTDVGIIPAAWKTKKVKNKTRKSKKTS